MYGEKMLFLHLHMAFGGRSSLAALSCSGGLGTTALDVVAGAVAAAAAAGAFLGLPLPLLSAGAASAGRGRLGGLGRPTPPTPLLALLACGSGLASRMAGERVP